MQTLTQVEEGIGRYTCVNADSIYLLASQYCQGPVTWRCGGAAAGARAFALTGKPI